MVLTLPVFLSGDASLYVLDRHTLPQNRFRVNGKCVNRRYRKVLYLSLEAASQVSQGIVPRQRNRRRYSYAVSESRLWLRVAAGAIVSEPGV